MAPKLNLILLLVMLVFGTLGPGPVFGHHCLGLHECNPDLDLDNDEAANNDDNCPFWYNPDQTDGDGDGLGNVCDRSVVVTCDVDRSALKAAAEDQTDVTFRLWDTETGGSQCGTDHVVPMDELVVLKVATERFGSQKARKFDRIEVVLGTPAPTQFCPGAENWLDLTIGTATLTCDFSATVPRNRRLLRTVQ